MAKSKSKDAKSKLSRKDGETKPLMGIDVKFSDTEKKLLEAYLMLSLEENATQITLQKVATKAEVSFGTVRYYFAQEDSYDLVQAAIIYIFQEAYPFIENQMFQARMNAGSGSFHPVELYLRANFNWLRQKYHHVHFVIFFYYLSMTKTKVGISSEMFFTRARTGLERLVIECVGLGLAEKPKDVTAIAHQIHLLTVGAIVNAGSENYPDKIDRCESMAIAGMRALLAQSH